ncbi:hypothetical protein AOQ73_26835 [Bradyrhizobium pachyrhizi]|uniref:hypothetical protein n=1 Tax=Bradyrhizobium pachyrhizi TaxID=280333 RepID=UPI0007054DBD|nr:hypothetical protein [Bradyrhizobium pachyrhizi]KRP89238.1 hypothetical protein AOQ73_26835 [Bradyrhizobium pachyrhizi]
MAADQSKASSGASADTTDSFEADVNDFSSHCAYIRTVYTFAMRIWRDSSDSERKLMEAISLSFFLDMGQVLAEYVVLSACRITDPANGHRADRRGAIHVYGHSHGKLPGNGASCDVGVDRWDFRPVAFRISARGSKRWRRWWIRRAVMISRMIE